MKRLARLFGDVRDALYPHGLAFFYADKLEELEEKREWIHAYLGRYMHVSPAEIEAMPMRRVRSYVRHIGAIVREENGPKKDDGKPGL